MVALYQAYLENVGQRFIVGIQGVCVHSFAATGSVVPEITSSQTDWHTHGRTHTDTHTDEDENIVSPYLRSGGDKNHILYLGIDTTI